MQTDQTMLGPSDLISFLRAGDMTDNAYGWGPLGPLQSGVEGISWPAIPKIGSAGLQALLWQLEESQWWPLDKLRQKQFEQLGLLLSHACRSVPFYRNRLALMGYVPGTMLDAEFWAQIPVLHREEIQTAAEALVSEALPKSHGRTRDIFTSGSTGKPVHAVLSKVRDLVWKAITVRDAIWHGRDLKAKLAVIRSSTKGFAPYPGGVRLSRSKATARLFETQPIVGLNVNTTAAEQAEWLQREDPDYLLTFPSIAQRLADHCLAMGIRFPRLREIETITERLSQHTRDSCLAAFGVPVVDMYSSREAGYLALQCPEYEHYHVQSEATLVEILDQQGRPCKPGEVGRVVVTPLHNFAMPLIRYDIGDCAEVGKPCPCGRELPVITRILGRRQDKVHLPTGEERWSLLSSGSIKKLLACAPIREYQMVQKAIDEIEMRLVVECNLAADEEVNLCDWVCQTFGYPFKVSLVCLDQIPRGAGGKTRDFISELSL